MKKFTKALSLILPAFLFVFLFASPTNAVFIQSGDNLLLPKEKKINETAVVAGSTLTIDSEINGDLYCAGRDIVINANIKGDVICASQSLKVNGSVDGNIRAVAQKIEVANQVSRSVTVGSQQLVFGPKSQVKGDIFFGVQNVDLSGSMGRDLTGAGEIITISGSLVRNATVTGKKLSLVETGKIGGNFDYYMEKTGTASIYEKNIKGKVTRHEIETPNRPEMKKDMAKVAGAALVIKTVLSIISFIVLGMALVYFDKKRTEKRLALIIAKPVVTGLIGFAALIAAPIAFIILMATVIGIPFAFVALLVYILALIIASFYPSMIYGKLFLEKVLKVKNSSLYGQAALGILLLGLVALIPVIGGLVAFISFCVGLGAFLTSMFPEKKAVTSK